MPRSQGCLRGRRVIAGELRSRHSTREPDVPRLAAVAGWHGTQTTAAAFCRGALSQSTEVSMHSKLLAIASAGVLMMAGTAAWAQTSTVEKTPGHIMQRTPQAKSTGPGASQYVGAISAERETRSHWQKVRRMILVKANVVAV